MSPARWLQHSAVVASLAAATPAIAADLPGQASQPDPAPIKFELIDSSRLGCGQGIALGASAGGSMQCAFDVATRGAQLRVREDWDKGSVEAYTVVAHATVGAFSPARLLESPENRSSEATDFFLVGLKGTALDERVKFTSEFASTRRTIDDLLPRNPMFTDGSRQSGTSAKLRIDAKLVSSPRLNWSMTAEMRTVDEDFAVGSSQALSRYAAMPGTRLTLSSRGRVGQLSLQAGLDRLRTSYGESTSRKAGLDVHGVTLRVVSRDSRARPIQGSILVGASTRTTNAHVHLDTKMMAASLLPTLGELPFIVPSMISLSVRSGESENRYANSTERYGRSSLGLDGTWETPIGETIISYWRDSRTGLTEGARSYSREMIQLSHFVRRGNWRFGLDGGLTRGSGEGGAGYDERSWSLGQSVAYSAPEGPEFRLALGQDRGIMRMSDDSFASSDDYSRITASLDLSRYLQKRFERPDLRLTLDYRKALDRTNNEQSLFDQMVERWVDGYRREGLLMSFGMKL